MLKYEVYVCGAWGWERIQDFTDKGKAILKASVTHHSFFDKRPVSVVKYNAATMVREKIYNLPEDIQ